MARRTQASSLRPMWPEAARRVRASPSRSLRTRSAARRESRGGPAAAAWAGAGVVDDGDGEVVGALQLAQVAEERGDIAGLVLVDAMEADEGVEQEQARGLALHSLGQPALVPG